MKEKKNNTGLVIIIVILVLIIIGLAGYIVYDKVFNTTSTTTKEDNTKVTDAKKEEIELKDSSKEVVYDGSEIVSNVKVPVININSKDAERLNEEISEYYKKSTKNHFNSIKYDFYVNDDIVSVVIEFIPGGFSTYYKVVNISQKTGYEVTNTELIENKNLTKESLISKMESIFMEKVKTSEGYSSHIYGDEFTSVEQATKNKIENLSLDDVSIYLNKSGNLCVIEEEYQFAGAERGYYIMNIDTNSYEQ